MAVHSFFFVWWMVGKIDNIVDSFFGSSTLVSYQVVRVRISSNSLHLLIFFYFGFFLCIQVKTFWRRRSELMRVYGKLGSSIVAEIRSLTSVEVQYRFWFSGFSVVFLLRMGDWTQF